MSKKQTRFTGDEAINDFIEENGGVDSFKNLTIIKKIITLILTVKEAINQENANDNTAKNTIESTKNFTKPVPSERSSTTAAFDDSRNSLIGNARASIGYKSANDVTSGYLFLQVNDQWQRLLIVIQNGIVKCYGGKDRRWKKSFCLKDYTLKCDGDFIYLNYDANKLQVIFENRDNSTLIDTKWKPTFLNNIKYANNMPSEELTAFYEREKQRVINGGGNNGSSDSTKGVTPNNEREPVFNFLSSRKQVVKPATTPTNANTTTANSENMAILAELRSNLREMINKGLQDADNDLMYQCGLKHALGKLCYIEGDKEEAVKLYLEACEGMKQYYGSDHTTTIECTDDLTALYIELKRYDLALPYLEEALIIRKDMLGNFDPTTLICKLLLKCILYSM